MKATSNALSGLPRNLISDAVAKRLRESFFKCASFLCKITRSGRQIEKGRILLKLITQTVLCLNFVIQITLISNFVFFRVILQYV